MLRWYCDRCGKEIDGASKKIVIDFQVRCESGALAENLAGFKGSKDMCADCAKDFLGDSLDRQIALKKKAMEEMLKAEEAKSKPQEGITLASNIDELQFSVRTYNCMKRAGYETLGDIINLKMENLVNVRNLGRRSAAEVMAVIKMYQFLKEDNNAVLAQSDEGTK